jgi:hypothetical protein
VDAAAAAVGVEAGDGEDQESAADESSRSART